MMDEVVLEIKKLTRRFGVFTAVDAVTLSVNAGEILGLLGSNGAGKTTMLSLIVGLRVPTACREKQPAHPVVGPQPVPMQRRVPPPMWAHR